MKDLLDISLRTMLDSSHCLRFPQRKRKNTSHLISSSNSSKTSLAWVSAVNNTRRVYLASQLPPLLQFSSPRAWSARLSCPRILFEGNNLSYSNRFAVTFLFISHYFFIFFFIHCYVVARR